MGVHGPGDGGEGRWDDNRMGSWVCTNGKKKEKTCRWRD